MIRIKIEKNRQNMPVFEISVKKEETEEFKFLKRALFESKSIKGRYNYEIPMKYFLPVINNLEKDRFTIDKKSILSYFEFSDEIDENYYYSTTATAKYMKLWREESCPNIYKVNIDIENKMTDKIVAFRKISFS